MARRKKPTEMEVQKEMCPTCPWRKDSKYAFLREELEASAMKNCSRICHSTGVNAIYRTKKPEKLCRGARDSQIAVFHALGFLSEPTDEAWAKKVEELKNLGMM